MSRRRGNGRPLSDQPETPAASAGFLMAVERLAVLGSWTLRADTGELWCSDHLGDLFEVEAAENATEGSARLLSRLAPHERRRLLSAVERCRSTGAPFSVRCSLVRSDGERRSLVVQGERALQSTEPELLWGIVQDISRFAIPSGGTSGSFGDPLTGLPNRPWLYQRAPEIFARASRRRWTTAVLAIDIDDMHEINAAVGSAAGDAVLIEVAQRLRQAFRPYDTVVRSVDETKFVTRLGGDLFMVLCEDVVDIAAARGLCQRVAAVLETPVMVGDALVEVTASVGAVLVPPGDPTLDDQLVRAETAMRSAKANGKNGYDIFSPSMVAGADMRHALTADLERALAEGEFRLVYQPKVALDGSGIVGVEALLRWEHPTRGLMAPDVFIPLAERTGLIIPIGAWVIEEACRQGQRWQRPTGHPRSLAVSVNVSALQIRFELVDVIRGALSATGLPASSLRLELTETVLMDDVDGALPVLLALADLGVSLSVDDFGTGHSSLAYLKRLPVDELKIDRSFIDGLGVDSDSTAIVAAVIAMAQALDLTVVAEGVETAEQLHHLERLGCDEAQGFHVGRPASAAVIDARLRGVDLPESSTQGQMPTSNSGQSVLVVDDATDIRQLARVSLAAAGFDVHEASSGSEAVALAPSVRPACVLLDVEMPGMSGIEVCRRLRNDPATADCTLIMLTARADAADKVEAFSIGADEYIVKPFSPRDLVGRVRAAIRRRAAQHGGGDGTPVASGSSGATRDDDGETVT